MGEVAAYAECLGHAAAAQHIACRAGNRQCPAAVVALQAQSRFGRTAAFILQATEAQAALQAERDLALHVGEPFLNQLVGGERTAKLVALQRVFARHVPTGFRRPQRAPRAAVARRVEAEGGALRVAHAGEGIFLEHENLVHALFKQEAAHPACLVPGPDDAEVGNGCVGSTDPVACQPIAARHAACACCRAAAADPLAAGKLRQIVALLCLAAEREDRQHDVRGLRAHHRAEARIDTLQLARDEAVADMVQAGTAVFRRQGRAQQAERAHLAEDRPSGVRVAAGRAHTRHQPVLRITLRRIAHHALVFGELGVEAQRVVPLEFVAGHRRILLSARWRV